VMQGMPREQELSPETREALLARFRTWKASGGATGKN